MGMSEVFTDVLNRIEQITVDNPIVSPKPSANFQRTQSNVNQIFKMTGIWNDQIDNEIQSCKTGERATIKGHVIKCPAVFIEFVPNDGNQILGGVTQYMEAAMYFHIFSDELNTPNQVQGLNQPSGDLMDNNFDIYRLRDIITSNFLGFHTYHGSAMMSRYDKLDYKHGTITKYLRGFHFCWNDDKGSIYDPKSSRYLLEQKIVDGNLEVTPKHVWVSGTNYVAQVNVAYYLGSVSPTILAGYYLCTTSNTDTTFIPANWQVLSQWVTLGNYAVGAYIFFGYYAYQCTVANNDVAFNADKWRLIVRM